MDQVKFVKTAFNDMVCLSRSYPFKFFKGCLTQILLGRFLNNLSQMIPETSQQENSFLHCTLTKGFPTYTVTNNKTAEYTRKTVTK